MGSKTSKSKENFEAIIVKPNGGLGNQLFQIANGYACSLRFNKRFFITSSWDGMSKDRPSYWTTCLKGLNKYLVEAKRVKRIKRYKEPKFSYSEIPKCKGHICLEGYYQSEKYFEEYKEAIKKLFILPEDLRPNFVKEGICVAIHIRRGDYLTKSDYHVNIERFYYDNAKKIIEEKLGFRPNYYYFSDDITWVQEEFKDSLLENDKFISGYKDYEELYIMSLCNHFIIANSTFSWWGTWLSVTQSEDSKIVIAPETWFGPSGNQDYQDIYCKNWIKIKSYFSEIDLLKEKYLKIDTISSSISESINGNINPYDLYVINLKHRKDRKNEVLNQLKDTITFNIKFFDAVKCEKGWVGCGLSHLSLVKYAYENDLPYIIVAEDDVNFKQNDFKNKELIKSLIEKIEDWKVFNGSPTFWDRRNDLQNVEIIKFENPSLNENFSKINWGQSTTFMIYTKASYKKLLNYNFSNDEIIDQYVSRNFIQTFYTKEPFCIQRNSYSDLSNKQTGVDYEKYFTNQYKIIKEIKLVNKELTIGIYSIFIDKYQVFYENFIKNCEENFLPQYTKYYYIVTDNKDLPKYNDRTFFFNTEKIGWPYETLYRFKYFLQFKEEVKKSDILYFVNSNGKFLEYIGSEVLPDSSGYVFTKHHGYLDENYNKMSYEKNNSKSTAYIQNQNIKFEYLAGGFYGATREKYINLCKTLNDNIDKDEKNNFIAIWHDESHINKYCLSVLNYKFKRLGIEYHVPEENMYKFKDKKLIYLNKHNYIPINIIKKGKPSAMVNKIVKNKYN
jgi:GR25 family glycosyltransferase involved in LPS biosynthesis